MSGKLSIFAEMKRRNVLRAAAFYAAAAWLLVQIATQVFPFYDVPAWAVRWVIAALAIGFPLWPAFAWFYEWTPHGIKRESDVVPADSVAPRTGRTLDFWIIGILAVAVALLLTDRFVLHKNVNEGAIIPAKSIAVLPLSNESGDKDQQYFSDGLSEGLITALAQFDGLKVISRNSAFQFRDSKDDVKTIGAKLGVAHLLEGSVRRAGDAVRINAELVNVADGSTLWSQRYDRPYQDLFKLQDDIANAVAGALKAKLLSGSGTATRSDRPPSGNLAAYTAYLQGKFHHARRTDVDDRKAIEAFTTAIRLDPRYAQAYAELSHTWTGHAGEFLAGALAQEAYAQARAAANTALTLDPNLPGAHVRLSASQRGFRLEQGGSRLPSRHATRTGRWFRQVRSGQSAGAAGPPRASGRVDPASAGERSTACNLVLLACRRSCATRAPRRGRAGDSHGDRTAARRGEFFRAIGHHRDPAWRCRGRDGRRSTGARVRWLAGNRAGIGAADWR
jgi:TolB-like protein